MTLKRDEIRLESFLVSQIFKHELRWPSPTIKGVEATSDEYKNHHVLLGGDDANTYIRSLIAPARAKKLQETVRGLTASDSYDVLERMLLDSVFSPD